MTDQSLALADEPNDAPLEYPAEPRQRILVVDDQPQIRQLYAEILTDSGYEVEVAEDGAVAWDALQKRRYDLLITDNEMPKVSGIELLQMLHAARMNLPVIMATGTFPRDEFINHPWLKPRITLMKPFILADFLLAVAEVFNPNHVVSATSLPPPVWQVRPVRNGFDFTDRTLPG